MGNVPKVPVVLATPVKIGAQEPVPRTTQTFEDTPHRSMSTATGGHTGELPPLHPDALVGKTGKEWYHGVQPHVPLNGDKRKSWEEYMTSPYSETTFKMIRPKLSRISEEEVNQPGEALKVDSQNRWWYTSPSKRVLDIVHQDKALERTRSLELPPSASVDRHVLTNPYGPIERSKSFPSKGHSYLVNTGSLKRQGTVDIEPALAHYRREQQQARLRKQQAYSSGET